VARKRLWPICVAAAGVLVLVLVAAFVWSSKDEIAIDGGLRVDESTLLVWGTTGSDTDTRRTCTVGVLGSDGVLRHVAREDGTLRMIGVVGDLVWLEHSERRLHARRLPDLSPVSGIDVRHHAVLSHGYQVLGFRSDGVVLSGSDGKRWRVDTEGTIDRDTSNDTVQPVGTMASAAEIDGVAWAEALGVVKRNDTFVNPIVVGTGVSSVPLELADPRGFIVRTFDLHAGGRTQSLHRVGTDGTLAWSLTVEQLADAVPLDNQVLTTAWVGMLDDELHALVQLAEVHHDQEYGAYYGYTHSLVRIDAASGHVADRRALAVEAQ
jgi:hypothetical protein